MTLRQGLKEARLVEVRGCRSNAAVPDNQVEQLPRLAAIWSADGLGGPKTWAPMALPQCPPTSMDQTVANGSNSEVRARNWAVCFTLDCVEKLENRGAPKISQM
jgi:hypothetical protein